MLILQLLIREVTVLFASDPSTASVTLSWLEGRNVWYGSVVRYTERFGEGKQVVAKTTHPDLEIVLRCLASMVGVVLPEVVVDYADAAGIQANKGTADGS
jgi:hypothetical protein